MPLPSKDQQKAAMHGKTMGMINAFVCPNLHTIVTINKDDGLLPMNIGCPHCDQPATSRLFVVNQDLGPTLEWWKPTPEEAEAMTLSMGNDERRQFLNMLASGFLAIREYKPTPTVGHG